MTKSNDKKKKNSNNNRSNNSTAVVVHRPMPLSRPNVHRAVHDVCSLSNPFCDGAQTAKYPDQQRSFTLPYRVVLINTISTDANGNAAFWVYPQFTYAVGTSTVTAGGITGAPTFDATGITLGINGYRVNSCGVKVMSIANLMTVQGVVCMREYNDTETTNLNAVDINQPTKEMLDYPLRKTQETCVVLQKSGQLTSMFRKTSLDDPTYPLVAPTGWNPILIAVSGGPASTAVLRCETVINYEFTFDDNGNTYRLATPPAKMDLALQQTSNSVLADVGTFVDKGVSALEALFQNKATKYIMGAIGGYLGGPKGASAGYMLGNGAPRAMIMDVD